MPATKDLNPSSVPETWSRLIIERIVPQVDCGQFPIARTIGEEVQVLAGIIVDGHEKLRAELVYRHENGEEQVVPMPLRWNDEYIGSFTVTELGRYFYYVRAWIDQFGTWQDQFRRRVEGNDSEYELQSELMEGAALLEKIVKQASGEAKKELSEYIHAFRSGKVEAGLDEALGKLAHANDIREGAVTSKTLEVRVDPVHARFCAWYEFFPRSAGDSLGKPATLDDAAARLPRIKELGFDVVYLPPVHPIGITNRKGKDNAPTAGDNDPGSPWAIGGKLADGTLGGHKSVSPELGGIEAFDRFVARATELGLKVALDIAFQTSPDHPYVQDHPEWFRRRPDGTIRYAENPPKKYQDVYPINFESEDRVALWEELRSVFEFWIDHGVRIFRVDNPHTKPFAFWEWCLDDLRRRYPDLIFLAEAFTRPKTMYMLAKIGFNQSYTYFTWRNSKPELEEYGRELFHTDVAEYFRPNFWPNTPDILHEYLVHGGRPAHVIRLILAATMSSAYGVYGPPYEHVEAIQHPQREEYANNEKYEIRVWNWNDPNSLQPIMSRINRIRRENPALHYMRNIRFHVTDNPQIMAYSKQAGDNLIIVVLSLDPFHTQSGWVHLPLQELGIPEDHPYEVQDLFGGEWYFWNGPHNFVRFDPEVLPAHILRVNRSLRTEKDFPTYA